ncbi:type II toxin-antitoxin system VapC family toxin [Agromyces mangrovi Wang et al. 2018]|uniref:type II toxin-antitoxin system VapC family toxin n=1 Tax=Agromyces mangrovi TaxID=1858653 RepID=UPI0025747381|nr:type II toxin-antitoxin system VapC family toxin [Agromyces mangrovi]BDZ64123.1 ribonuclease VapC28 [Agromyces mangrovi]
MIVDTSAIIAILRDEPAAPACVAALASSTSTSMSAGTFIEASVVIDSNRDPVLSARFDELVAEAGIEVVPIDAELARIARAAYRDYGKGSGHPARLNLGDCFAYALARSTGEPLLCIGDDFRQTDLRLAVDPTA